MKKSHRVGFGLAGLALLAAGCKGPLQRSQEQALRESLLRINRAYVQAVAPEVEVVIDRPESEVVTTLSAERRAQLEAISGPEAYQQDRLDLDLDLRGQADTPIVRLSLERAIALAMEHNVQVQGARLEPAINRARLTQAEAVFDATAFIDVNFAKTERPPDSASFGENFVSTTGKSLSFNYGIRKPLATGGQIIAQSTIAHNMQPTTFFGGVAAGAADYDANIALTLSHPLLRNFGSDINRAQITLARSARAASVQELKRRLLDVATAVEEAYWQLVFARQRLFIQQRLLERSVTDRDIILRRQDFDATPPQLTEANSFVEARRADLIRARQDVRRASDVLKVLVNSPDLPVSSETLILPVERPVELPISFSLLDAVATALQNRPEIRQALLAIDDASVRQRVAQNQLLPLLDLVATLRYNGTGERGHWAYDEVIEGQFIDYLLGAQFEAPLGNRQRRAAHLQRVLERQLAAVNYQAVMQQVVLEVKNALRDVKDQYELISAERAARLAAADNLRALETRQQIAAELTPEFIDLKLRRQEALAAAELREYQALVEYNTAIANFFEATGTLLERNGIELADPEAE